jgi:hypothetical protein
MQAALLKHLIGGLQLLHEMREIDSRTTSPWIDSCWNRASAVGPGALPVTRKTAAGRRLPASPSITREVRGATSKVGAQVTGVMAEAVAAESFTAKANGVAGEQLTSSAARIASGVNANIENRIEAESCQRVRITGPPIECISI